ncbi:MAG: His/Gly/Thr/Pro-type tRNA ligase C-terminal domain-containing protein [Candidatus Curtissbacteria bacterium]|nr:His/Gly/Thr/Pro-type tRNA ligase C-terminal domain-containing protein [Candidatus Curtissbacteria bacterium]
MRYSQLFGKTSRQVPRDEGSINAKLLIRAGFIRKEVAGVYNYLPLGLRVLEKISNIVREEMNAAGGQEVKLVSLQNKDSWEKTGRWKKFDALFQVKSRYKAEYALGPTHEEVIVPIATEFVKSYRDLPFYVYQIQNKFRDEPRAKGGLLRGREFLMKDLYSFHATEAEMLEYYEVMKGAYKKVFERVGLDAIETRADGGTFSEFSDEYQVICESGEDEIIYCPGGDYAENSEIAQAKEGQECVLGHGSLKRAKTIEVGNIFPLRDNFSKTFGLTFKDKDGKEQPVMMGCYGIGISRLMGSIVEVFNDDKGITWPKGVSPYDVHLVHIEDPGTEQWAKETYEKLTKSGIDVLWDDREDASAGQKFADADLIGIPVRLIVSKKTGGSKVEWKERASKDSELISLDEAVKRISSSGQPR